MFQKNITMLFLLCSMAMVYLAPLTSPSAAESRKWGPWDSNSIYEKKINNQQSQQHEEHIITKTTTSPLKLLITFFQKVISPVDGATCDFYPTCSAYAKHALKKHGFFIGLAMASERINRDHAPEGYDLIFKFGRYYIYDPVENNDSWFYKRRDKVR
jgi:putative membrane protein insertion efficiency factor